MNRDERYIGTHIVIDMVSKNADLLREEGTAHAFLNKVIDLAEMTCLVAPKVFKFPYASEHIRFLEKLEKEGTRSPVIDEAISMMNYNKTEGSGVTGFTILCESHACLHSFPEKDEPFISICLYSCKPYDEKKIIEYASKHFDAKRMDIIILNRFIGRPQELQQLSLEF